MRGRALLQRPKSKKPNLHSLGLTTPWWSIVELYQPFVAAVIQQEAAVTTEKHGLVEEP